MSGGGPVPPTLKRAWRDELSIPLVESYGQSELGGFVALGYPELETDDRKLMRVGPPLPDKEVAIFDAEDQAQPPGQIGEIVLRGGFMTGYWDKSAKTAEATRGGWLRTGDVGIIDTDGYVTMRGRRSELIEVEGNSNNATDGIHYYQIASVSSSTITLVGSDSLTAESGKSVTIAAVVPDPQNPTGTITAIQIDQRDDVNINASGKIDVTAGTNVYIGSELDIRIDQGLNVVSSATFHFAGSLSDVGSSIAKLGEPVEVQAPEGGVVFKGAVTGIEVDRSATGDHVTTITALDPLHQLSGRSRVLSRTKVTVSDVLKMIAQE